MQVHPIDGVDIKDKFVLLKEENLKEEYKGIFHRLVKATGGFGCSPNTMGRAVFTQGVFDHDEARWDRSDIEGWVSDADVSELISTKMMEG